MIVTVIQRPTFDGPAIAAWVERERRLEPRRCERCRRLARPGTKRCAKHAEARS